MQLSKEIGVTQKSAWFMLGRIREACGQDLGKLNGVIEIDETYVGGKEKNKHANKRIGGRGTRGKVPVIGMREDDGLVIAEPLNNVKIPTIKEAVRENVESGSEIFTDEATAYKEMPEYKHEFVTHSKEEYVRGDVTTNGVESVWAILKRGLNGVYHGRVEKKHLARYVNEFTFRLNDGNVTRTTQERLTSLIDASIGKRLTYKKLTEVV